MRMPQRDESHQYVVFKIRNRVVQSLLDSGSPRSLTASNLVQQFHFKLLPLEDPSIMISATGQALRLIGKTYIPCLMNELNITQEFIVVDRLFPNLILGTDFLSQNHAVINFGNKTVEVLNGLISLPLQQFQSNNSCAVVNETVVIPRFSEAVLAVKIPKMFPAEEVLLELLKSNATPVLVAGCLSVVQNGMAYVRVLNCQPNSVILKKNLKIASLVFPENVNSVVPFKGSGIENCPDGEEIDKQTLDDFIKEYKININDSLTSDDRYKLTKLLYKYKDIFARNISEMRTYEGFELELYPRNPHLRSYTRQYKLNEEDKNEASHQINDLLKQGLIEPMTDCSFNSPCFLVKKKDGSSRMVVDLRHINSFLKPLIVALPKIEYLLSELAASTPNFISSFDCFKGYFSIRLNLKTRHYTSSSNPKTGISYSYRVLPMGLHTSAAAFVLAMGKVFQNKELFHFLYIYMDDICCCSKSLEEHLKHLELTFQTLKANNLRLNPTKANIGYQEIEFLGSNVSHKGISISPSKIQAIKNMQSPTSKKSLMRTLGLLQYFRKYVPNFSGQTANMRQLLKQNEKFIWTGECQKEFENLKAMLIEAPILQSIRNDRPIFIYIDGSVQSVGSCVIQHGEDGLPHSCGYISFATNDSQKRWAPYQLELLALGLSLRQFETVFLHADLTVFTDNAVVASIQTYKAVNNREKRLLSYISQFPMKIRYLPGRKNILADCLSRIGEDMEISDLNKFKPPPRLYDEEFILAVNQTQGEKKSCTTVINNETTDHQLIHSGKITVQASEAQPSTLHINSLQQLAAAQAPSQPVAPDLPIATGQSIDRPAELTESIEKMQQPVRRSKRIAGRKAKIAEENKIKIEQDARSAADSATENAQKAKQGESRPKSTNEIFRELHDPSLPVDDMSICELAMQINDLLNMPELVEEDYKEDEFFSPIYIYLKENKLMGNDDIDRKTLLLAEYYLLKDNLLYKVSLPRARREKRVQSEEFRLCIPQKHKNTILLEWHALCGHFGTSRLLPTLLSRFYWATMISDVKNISKLCSICQKSKINPRQDKMPLFPLPTPKYPFQIISFDHKTLSRKTELGNTHILAIVCHFSGWPIFKAVPDESSYTTAKVIVEEVISNFGVPSIFLSDRAPGYTSKLFETINQILCVRHRFTASQSKRSNAKAERAIRSLNEGLKIFGGEGLDDLKIEVILPLIQIAMRSAVNPSTNLSAYEVLFVRKMPLPTSFKMDQPVPDFCNPDSGVYVKWLRNALNSINEGVRLNQVENKLKAKETYDKKYKVKIPDYSVGQTVLLKDNRIEANSNKLLTRRPYQNDEFLIVEVVQSGNIGPAYKLLNKSTVKLIKNLVNFDRIKAFHTPDDALENITPDPSQFALGIKIMEQRQTEKGQEYLVYFANGQSAWCLKNNVGIFSQRTGFGFRSVL